MPMMVSRFVSMVEAVTAFTTSLMPSEIPQKSAGEVETYPRCQSKLVDVVQLLVLLCDTPPLMGAKFKASPADPGQLSFCVKSPAVLIGIEPVRPCVIESPTM